jgi:hypothetical protein
MDENIIDVGLLLKDLKDFYIWKTYVNNPNFVSEWIKDREELLNSIPRPTMSK